MDRKLWFTGGEPNVVADDLDFNENAIRAGINNAIGAYSTPIHGNFIVKGCELTIMAGVNASVSAGYIYLNGELLVVDAQSAADGGNDEYKFIKQVSYDPKGHKVYNDGQTRETWEVNRAILTNAPTPPAATELDAKGRNMLANVKDLIKGDIVSYISQSFTIAQNQQYIKAGLSGSGVWVITLPPANSVNGFTPMVIIDAYKNNPTAPELGTYTVKDANGVIIGHISSQTQSIFINDGVTWQLFSQNCTTTEPPIPAPIEVLTGGWDMNGTGSISISHGLTNWHDIKNISVQIINDDEDLKSQFVGDKMGRLSWDSTNVILTRENGSKFKNNEYNDLAINRGVIYIYI